MGSLEFSGSSAEDWSVVVVVASAGVEPFDGLFPCLKENPPVEV